MRVIRRKGMGPRVEVTGSSPVRRERELSLPQGAVREISRALHESESVILARLLERRIGRNGGMRDTRPGFSRDKYHTFAVDRFTAAWIKKQANERGLSRGAFLGMIIEAAKEMKPDDLDDLLAGETAC